MVKYFIIMLLLALNSNAFENKHFNGNISATDFKNVTLLQAVEALQRKSQDISGTNGFNYVFSTKAAATVSKKVDISLSELPLAHAIKYVAMMANLKVSYNNATVIFLGAKEKFSDPILKDKFTKPNGQLLSILKVKSGEYNFYETSMKDAIKAIREESRKIDPGKKGLNILLLNSAAKSKIYMKCQKVTYYSLVKYIALASGIKIKLEPSALVIK